MRLLLINPNTSIHITERMATSARTVLAPNDDMTVVTATDGPSVVRSSSALALAEAGALALADRHATGHDAMLLAISLDGAAPALRHRHPDHVVVGMTEAALVSACLRVDRVGILTLGSALLPLYRERIAQIGLASRVVAYEAPNSSEAFGAGTARIEPSVLELLGRACRRLLAAQADAVVLAGAVLCGYAAALEALCGKPVFDGAVCGVLQTRALLAARALSRQ